MFHSLSSVSADRSTDIERGVCFDICREWVSLADTDPQAFEVRLAEATAGDGWVMAITGIALGNQP